MIELAKPSNEKRIVLAVLVLVLIAGATLRIVKLGSESLWLDEAYSIYTSQESLPAIVQETSKDVHPPLYYLQLSLWALLSHDDFWLMANAIFWSTAFVFVPILNRAYYGITLGLVRPIQWDFSCVSRMENQPWSSSGMMWALISTSPIRRP